MFRSPLICLLPLVMCMTKPRSNNGIEYDGASNVRYQPPDPLLMPNLTVAIPAKKVQTVRVVPLSSDVPVAFSQSSTTSKSGTFLESHGSQALTKNPPLEDVSQLLLSTTPASPETTAAQLSVVSTQQSNQLLVHPPETDLPRQANTTFSEFDKFSYPLKLQLSLLPMKDYDIKPTAITQRSTVTFPQSPLVADTLSPGVAGLQSCIASFTTPVEVDTQSLVVSAPCYYAIMRLIQSHQLSLNAVPQSISSNAVLALDNTTPLPTPDSRDLKVSVYEPGTQKTIETFTARKPAASSMPVDMATHTHEFSASHAIIQQNTTSQSFQSTASQSFVNVDSQPSPAATKFQTAAANIVSDRQASETSHSVTNLPLTFETPIQTKIDQVSYKSDSALKQTQISTTKTELTSQSQVETTHHTVISEPDLHLERESISQSEVALQSKPILLTPEKISYSQQLTNTKLDNRPSTQAATSETPTASVPQSQKLDNTLTQDVTASHGIIQQNTSSQLFQSTASQSFLNVDSRPSPAATNFQMAAVISAKDRQTLETSHSVTNLPVTYETPLQTGTDQVSYKSESALKQTQMSTTKTEVTSQSQVETTHQTVTSEPALHLERESISQSETALQSKTILDTPEQIPYSQQLTNTKSENRKSTQAAGPETPTASVLQSQILDNTVTQEVTTSHAIIQQNTSSQSFQSTASQSFLNVDSEPSPAARNFQIAAANIANDRQASEISHSVTNLPVTYEAAIQSGTDQVSYKSESALKQTQMSTTKTEVTSQSQVETTHQTATSEPVLHLERESISPSEIALQSKPILLPPEHFPYSEQLSNIKPDNRPSPQAASPDTPSASILQSQILDNTLTQEVTASHAIIQQNTSSQSFHSTASQSFLNVDSQLSPAATNFQMAAAINASGRQASETSHSVTNLPLTFKTPIQTKTDQVSYKSESALKQTLKSTTKTEATSQSQENTTHQAVISEHALQLERESISPSETALQSKTILDTPEQFPYSQQLTNTKSDNRPSPQAAGSETPTDSVPQSQILDKTLLQGVTASHAKIQQHTTSQSFQSTASQSFINVDSQPSPAATNFQMAAANIATDRQASETSHSVTNLPLTFETPIQTKIDQDSYKSESALKQTQISTTKTELTSQSQVETARHTGISEPVLHLERESISPSEVALQSKPILLTPEKISYLQQLTNTKPDNRPSPQAAGSETPTASVPLSQILDNTVSQEVTASHAIIQQNTSSQSFQSTASQSFLNVDRRLSPAATNFQMAAAISGNDRRASETSHSVTYLPVTYETPLQTGTDQASYKSESALKQTQMSTTKTEVTSQSQVETTHQTVTSEPVLHLERESISPSEIALQSKPILLPPEHFPYSEQLSNTNPDNRPSPQAASPDTPTASVFQSQILDNTLTQEVTASHAIIQQNMSSQSFQSPNSQSFLNVDSQPSPAATNFQMAAAKIANDRQASETSHSVTNLPITYVTPIQTKTYPVSYKSESTLKQTQMSTTKTEVSSQSQEKTTHQAVISEPALHLERESISQSETALQSKTILDTPEQIPYSQQLTNTKSENRKSTQAASSETPTASVPQSQILDNTLSQEVTASHARIQQNTSSKSFQSTTSQSFMNTNSQSFLNVDSQPSPAATNFQMAAANIANDRQASKTSHSVTNLPITYETPIQTKTDQVSYKSESALKQTQIRTTKTEMTSQPQEKTRHQAVISEPALYLEREAISESETALQSKPILHTPEQFPYIQRLTNTKSENRPSPQAASPDTPSASVLQSQILDNTVTQEVTASHAIIQQNTSSQSFQSTASQSFLNVDSQPSPAARNFQIAASNIANDRQASEISHSVTNLPVTYEAAIQTGTDHVSYKSESALKQTQMSTTKTEVISQSQVETTHQTVTSEPVLHLERESISPSEIALQSKPILRTYEQFPYSQQLANSKSENRPSPQAASPDTPTASVLQSQILDNTVTQEVTASHAIIQQNTSSESFQSTASQSFLNVDSRPSPAATNFQMAAAISANDRQASETSHSVTNLPVTYETPIQTGTDQVSYKSESAVKQRQMSKTKTEVTSQSQVKTTHQTVTSEPVLHLERESTSPSEIALQSKPILLPPEHFPYSEQLSNTNPDNRPSPQAASPDTPTASVFQSQILDNTLTQEVTASHAIIQQNMSSQSFQSPNSQSFLNVDSQPSPAATNFQMAAAKIANDRQASETSHSVTNLPITYVTPIQTKTYPVSYKSESTLKQTQMSTTKTEVSSQSQEKTTHQAVISEPALHLERESISQSETALQSKTILDTPEQIPYSQQLTNTKSENRKSTQAASSETPTASVPQSQILDNTLSQEVTASHARIQQNTSSKSFQSTTSQSFMNTNSQSFLNVDSQPSPAATNFQMAAANIANDRQASKTSHSVTNLPITYETPIQTKTDQVSYKSESALKQTQIRTTKTEMTSQPQEKTRHQAVISEPALYLEREAISESETALQSKPILHTPEQFPYIQRLTNTKSENRPSPQAASPDTPSASVLQSQILDNTVTQEVTASHAIIQQNTSSQSFQSTASQSFLNVDSQPSPAARNFQIAASNIANDRQASEISHSVTNLPVTYEAAIQTGTDHVSYKSESALKQTQMSTTKTEVISQSQVETTHQTVTSEPVLHLERESISPSEIALQSKPILRTYEQFPYSQQLANSKSENRPSPQAASPDTPTASVLQSQILDNTVTQEVTASHAIIQQNTSSESFQSTASQSFLNVDSRPSPAATNFQMAAAISANDRQASETSHSVTNLPVTYETPIQTGTDQVSYKSESAVKQRQMSKTKTEVTSQSQVKTTHQTVTSEPVLHLERESTSPSEIALQSKPILLPPEHFPYSEQLSNTNPDNRPSPQAASPDTPTASVFQSQILDNTLTQEVTASHAIIQQNMSSQSFQSPNSQSFLNVDSQPSPAATNFQMAAAKIANDRQASETSHSVTNLPITYVTPIQTKTYPVSYKSESTLKQTQMSTTKTEVSSQSQEKTTHQAVISEPALHLERESTSPSEIALQSKPILLPPEHFPYSEQLSNTNPDNRPSPQAASPDSPTASVPQSQILDNTLTQDVTASHGIIQQNTSSQSFQSTASQSFLNVDSRPSPAATNFQMAAAINANDRQASETSHSVTNLPVTYETPIQTGTDQVSYKSDSALKQTQMSKTKTEVTSQSQEKIPHQAVISEPALHLERESISQSETALQSKPILHTPEQFPYSQQLTNTKSENRPSPQAAGPETPTANVRQSQILDNTVSQEVIASHAIIQQNMSSQSFQSTVSQSFLNTNSQSFLNVDSQPSPATTNFQMAAANNANDRQASEISHSVTNLSLTFDTPIELYDRPPAQPGVPESPTVNVSQTHIIDYILPPELRATLHPSLPVTSTANQTQEVTAAHGIIQQHTISIPFLNTASQPPINNILQPVPLTVTVSQSAIVNASQLSKNVDQQSSEASHSIHKIITSEIPIQLKKESTYISKPEPQLVHSSEKELNSQSLVEITLQPLPKSQLSIPTKSKPFYIPRPRPLPRSRPFRPLSKSAPQAKISPLLNVPQPQLSPETNAVQSVVVSTLQDERDLVSHTEIEALLSSNSITKPQLTFMPVEQYDTKYVVTLQTPTVNVPQSQTVDTLPEIAASLPPTLASLQPPLATAPIVPPTTTQLEVNTAPHMTIQQNISSPSIRRTAPQSSVDRLLQPAPPAVAISLLTSANSMQRPIAINGQTPKSFHFVSNKSTASKTLIQPEIEAISYVPKSEALPKPTLIHPQDMDLTSHFQIDSFRNVPKPINISESELPLRQTVLIANPQSLGAIVSSPYLLNTSQVPVQSVNVPDSFTPAVENIQERRLVPETKPNPISPEPVQSAYPLKVKLRPSLVAVKGSESKCANTKLPAALPSRLPKPKSIWQSAYGRQSHRTTGYSIATSVQRSAPYGSEPMCKEKNGYFAVKNKCDTYIQCQQYNATKLSCPDGLHFNPAAKYYEYPCVDPVKVNCIAGIKERKSKMTGLCHKQYGLFPMEDGDCSKYIMCNAGVASIMNCPAGLVFNPSIQNCDWLANVPQCNSKAFKDYKCPELTVDDSSLDSDMIFKYKYEQHCKLYIACQRGYPRLLSCANGLAFDEVSHSCIKAEYVQGCSPNTA